LHGLAYLKRAAGEVDLFDGDGFLVLLVNPVDVGIVDMNAGELFYFEDR